MPHLRKKKPTTDKDITYKRLDLQMFLKKRRSALTAAFTGPDFNADCCLSRFLRDSTSDGVPTMVHSYMPHTESYLTLKAKRNISKTDPKLWPQELKIVESSSPNHVQIIDKAHTLLAYRLRVPMELITTLESSAQALPIKDPKSEPKPGASQVPKDNASRGPFLTRNYIYGPFYSGKNPFYHSNFLDDLPYSDTFIRENCPLFNMVSSFLRVVDPQTAHRFEAMAEYGVEMRASHAQKYRKAGLDPPSNYQPLCSSFAGCAVNRGMRPTVNADQPNSSGCELHRDYNDSASAFSVLVPFGDFTGGNVILKELGMELEVKRGDVLFFKGSIITHGNRPILSGERNSLAIYSSTKTLDWTQLARMGETDLTTYAPTQQGKAFQDGKNKARNDRNKVIREEGKA